MSDKLTHIYSMYARTLEGIRHKINFHAFWLGNKDPATAYVGMTPPVVVPSPFVKCL